ncbi:MAG: aldehyde ferredoxin oxidoreductase, partial [Deltaproteobacteria bacterium]|nr:aldehyde ferredoxin oxidoreductase [Deltaproteobacteria bacterium]
ATGAMLGVMDCFAVLAIIDAIERVGLDVMSAGVALAWATEGLAKGILSEKETLAALKFGDAQGYKEAVRHLALGTNDFYRLLGQGTWKAAAHYGGQDFACVLGQEMGGYATGEVFFVSQALGFRHSHLDAGGYSYDQKHPDKNVAGAIDFLLQDEKERAFLTSMVACLFARNVYTEERLGQCLRSVGYSTLADNMASVSDSIQRLRWQTRRATGFDPQGAIIPKRFTEVVNWKGPVDESFLQSLKTVYGQRILGLAQKE